MNILIIEAGFGATDFALGARGCGPCRDVRMGVRNQMNQVAIRREYASQGIVFRESNLALTEISRALQML